MALTTAQVARIKFELGYNLLSAGAEPYISVAAVFEQVIADNITAGAETTSTLGSAIAATTTPTPQTLTLASAAGFAVFDKVSIDVDARQELATVQSVTGADIVVLLVRAHSGTIPVSVDGGESVVRDLLRRIQEVKERIAASYGTGAVKVVDEIEFFDPGGKTQTTVLSDQLMWWRKQLAHALGVVWLWDSGSGSGSDSYEVY